MSIAVVTGSWTLLTDSDSNSGWASDGGGGAGPQNEPDLGYQLSTGANYSVSRKIGTTKGGHGYTDATTWDMSFNALGGIRATAVWMAKAIWYNSINSAPYPACTLKIGQDDANYLEYAIIDDGGQGDLDPDPKRLVYILPIDPSSNAFPDIRVGATTASAFLQSIDFFGIQGDFGGAAKAENVALDAIHLISDDGVLWFYGGGETEPSGSFADFVAFDEGDITIRIGGISTLRPSVFDVYGMLWIGRDTSLNSISSSFEDSAKTVLFGDGRFQTGWTGIGVDIGDPNTEIVLNDMLLLGQGKPSKRIWFDSSNEAQKFAVTPFFVRTGSDIINAEAFQYDQEGVGSRVVPSSTSIFFVELSGSQDIDEEPQFWVHDLRDNARNRVTPVDGSGSLPRSQSWRRPEDTRPDLEMVGQSGTFSATKCTFEKWRRLTLTPSGSLNSCTIRKCHRIDMDISGSGGTVDGCTISAQTTEPGNAFIKAQSLDDITNNSFEMSPGSHEALNQQGHAIEITQPGTYQLDGNTFTGYWTSPNNNSGSVFTTSDGVGINVADSEITASSHGFYTGEEIWYDNNGGTDLIGELTSSVRYYARKLTDDSFSVHYTRWLADRDSGRLWFVDGTGESHTFYSGNAVLLNSSSGSVTVNVTNGTAISVRNYSGSLTTIVASVPITITVIDEDGAVVPGASVYVQDSAGPFNDDDQLIRTETDGSGVVSDSIDFSGTVVIRVRLKGYSPFDGSGIVDANGLTQTVRLISDSIQE